MGFQPVNNTAEAKLVYNVDGGPDINNSVYVNDDAGDWDGAALSDLADSIELWWNADIKPLQVAACVLQKIECRDLEEQYGFKFTKVVGTPGTRAGTPTPASIAAVIRYTGDPGKPPRMGKLFHPGAAEADIDGNLFTQAYVDALQAGYDSLRSEGSFHVSWALGIVSRYSGYTLVERPDGTKFKKPTQRDPAIVNTIGDTVVERRYGIQKRRRPSPL